MDDLHLHDIFDQSRYGSRIRTCIQCGTCSASCPLTQQMDHAPRELFALIRDGEMEAVLSSDTPWYCVSCYQCMVRCPQEIPVTDIMYTLKQMAIRYDYIPITHKLPDLYRVFIKELERNGRITGAMLLIKYGMRHPEDFFRKMLLGLKLLTKMRIEFHPQKTKHPKKIAHLLNREGWNE
ncbi:MAG: 4Fe-4S dicluster domain-containing protein [Desulfobacterales bacterium]